MSPTVLVIRGWRLFFYSNEGHEPVHIHAAKRGADCKWRVLPSRFDIREARSHGLSPTLRREIRRIIFDHMDEIVAAWEQHFGEPHHEWKE